MSGKKDISEVLRQAEKLYRIETADNVKREDVALFLKTSYADQFNASDYKNDKDILARWEWSNIKNPNIEEGEFPAWFCKERNGEEIVGHLGVIPVSIKIGNDYRRAVWGKDMIVPAKWRRSGIASLLFDTTMKRIKDRKALFLLGGSNDYAVTIYKRLGFAHLGYISLYVRILKLDAILQKAIGNPFLRNVLKFFAKPLLGLFYMSFLVAIKAANKNICIKETAHFDDSFDLLWEKVSPRFPIIVRRDSGSLNWRFVNQPYWNYKIFKAEDAASGELKGYVVLREGLSNGLRTGIISDFFTSPDDTRTMYSLGYHAIRYFKKSDRVDLVRCDILNKKFERILKRMGFIRIRSKSHFMVGNVDKECDPGFILNRDNWFISYADSDLDLSGRR